MLVVSALFLSACGASTATGDHQTRSTMHLAYDADAQRSVRMGDTIAFDVKPVDGKVPQVRVCGLYGAKPSPDPLKDPLPKPDAVLAPVAGERSTYRAVAAGKVGLCGVRAQVIEQCQKRTCTDLMGDLKPLVTVTVTEG